jgi:hypothetical protein
LKVAILVAVAGIGLITVVLWDGFETVVLPRRVTNRVRLTRLFYRVTWRAWSTLVRRISSGKRQDNLVSFYGPFSLLLLLSLWACILIFGFSLLLYASGPAIRSAVGNADFSKCLYFSGTTFFTLGLGDVVPTTTLARSLTIAEAGMGLGFLALVIGYLPALNQSFSRREVNISLLDARAGSPPTAAEMAYRHRDGHGMGELRQLLHDWELWSAELLESHLSYPVLAYFRSQHENQSWLAALTTVLDTSALVMVGLEGACQRQGELTFAMARHAVVDLCLVLSVPPRKPEADRLGEADLAHLRAYLRKAGLMLREGDDADLKLKELRLMYEPYIHALSKHLLLALPPWISEAAKRDNWETSAWESGTVFRRGNSRGRVAHRHF